MGRRRAVRAGRRAGAGGDGEAGIVGGDDEAAGAAVEQRRALRGIDAREQDGAPGRQAKLAIARASRQRPPAGRDRRPTSARTARRRRARGSEAETHERQILACGRRARSDCSRNGVARESQAGRAPSPAPRGPIRSGQRAPCGAAGSAPSPRGARKAARARCATSGTSSGRQVATGARDSASVPPACDRRTRTRRRRTATPSNRTSAGTARKAGQPAVVEQEAELGGQSVQRSILGQPALERARPGGGCRAAPGSSPASGLAITLRTDSASASSSSRPRVLQPRSVSAGSALVRHAAQLQVGAAAEVDQAVAEVAGASARSRAKRRGDDAAGDPQAHEQAVAGLHRAQRTRAPALDEIERRRAHRRAPALFRLQHVRQDRPTSCGASATGRAVMASSKRLRDGRRRGSGLASSRKARTRSSPQVASNSRSNCRLGTASASGGQGEEVVDGLGDLAPRRDGRGASARRSSADWWRGRAARGRSPPPGVRTAVTPGRAVSAW